MGSSSNINFNSTAKIIKIQEEYKNPYKLSKDYNRLKHLLDEGYEIVCFANYHSGSDNICRDICIARKTEHDNYYCYEVGARGIWYAKSNTHNTKYFSFNEAMENVNVEFIDI